MKQIQRTVEPGLTAHRRQYGIRLFALDDFFYYPPVNRLYVDGVGHRRVGHDGGRVGINQYHPVVFLAQCLTGLCTGVVKFTSLADHNGPGPYDQYAFYIVAAWHISAVSSNR